MKEEPKLEPIQEIKKLSQLLEIDLNIPDYQRPYKWKKENVIKLLEDIFENIVTSNKNYRLGSLIIHFDKEEQKNKVVDGLQRLTTISILLKLLGVNNRLLLNKEYNHKISKNNIAYNAKEIKKWLDSKFVLEENRNNLKTQLLNKCEFVLFTVFNQDEAFQLFDSQNARGKALEPYDLLKAFHLREMEFDSEEERIACVQKWEKSIDTDELKQILGNHLFRIRKWSKDERRYDFTKNDIDEFKGISLHKKQKYPYETALRIIDGFVENAQRNKLFKNVDIAQVYPFSITMPIINGKRFFEYVEYYTHQKSYLLNEKHNSGFNKFYKEHCIEYYGSWRSGDSKILNLFENILLLLIDKFGFTEDFDKFYIAFYKEVYALRCNNKSIRLETILNSNQKRILQSINEAFSSNKLNSFLLKEHKITTTELVNGVEPIKKFINNEQ